LKICGVTFDHTTNYGSCLQAYALQNVIEGMEIGGEKCEYKLIPRSTFPTKKIRTRNPIILAKRLIYGRLNAYRRTKFAYFEDKYLHFADCHSRDELHSLNNQYDVFICGSDVIWNFTYTSGDPIFFLDFAEKYKFSYAASFGKADLSFAEEGILLSESPDDIYRKYISQLNAVSVREKYAVKLAKQYTDRPVHLVCDPTILLSAEDWRLLLDSNIDKGRYIFAYSTSTRPNYISFLKVLQKQTKLPVINVTWLNKDMIKQRTLYSPSPQEWLSLLYGAEYVVTNSFHGTAFSVIFKKKFFTAIQGERKVRSNIRLYDFLEDLHLEDRLYSTTPQRITEESPDFSYADQKIAQWRDQSLQYIHENLNYAFREKNGHES